MEKLVLAVLVFLALSSVEGIRHFDHPHHTAGRDFRRDHVMHGGGLFRQMWRELVMRHRHNDVNDPCPKICTFEYDPVCGSNGKTYANDCELKAEACVLRMRLFVVHEGRCEDYSPED